MFTNTTTIDKKAFYALNKKTALVMLFCLGCSLISLTCAIFLHTLNYKFVYLAYIFTALLLLLGLYILFKYKQFEKKAIGQTTIYTFEESSFTATTNNSSSQINYSLITEQKCEPNYLLLYINKMQVFVIEKSQMSKEFFEFINKKIFPQKEQDNS
jgi:hypothetical protein